MELRTRTACLLAAVAAVAAGAGTPAAAQGGCAQSLASGLASRGPASQLVTVLAADEASTTGTMRLWSHRGGCWMPAAGPWIVFLGFGGVSEDHHEGDGTTPAGAFRIGPVIYGVAADPGVRFRYHRLVCGDWWNEDPSSAGYNTFQHVPCGTSPPFRGSSEPLWESTRAYAHFAFVEYNTDPSRPGRGSAIFIHADLGHPTNGCVSLPPARLVRLLRWLRPAAEPIVAIGTAAQLRRL